MTSGLLKFLETVLSSVVQFNSYTFAPKVFKTNFVLEYVKAARSEFFLRSIFDLAFDRYTNGSVSEPVNKGK